MINSNISRRSLIKLALAGGVSTFFPFHQLQAAQKSNHTLIYVFLRGGLDALSWCPPLNGTLAEQYKLNRNNISYEANGIGNDFSFGINKLLPNTYKHFAEKNLSLCMGLGSLNPSMSHFEQMDYIEGGNKEQLEKIGFFQRLSAHLDSQNSPESNNLYSIEKGIPKSMRGNQFVMQFQKINDLATHSKKNFKFGSETSEILTENFGDNDYLSDLGNNLARESSRVYNAIKNIGTQEMPIKKFSIIADLVKSNLSPSIITTSIGGWDHHANLKENFANDEDGLATALDVSLGKLIDEVKTSGKWRNTSIFLMSEFGRRIVENGSAGCDHGRGGIGILAGGGFNGGDFITGRGPGGLERELTELFQVTKKKQSNIPVSIDYRSVLAHVFEKNMGLSSEVIENQVFPNFKKDQISF